MTTSKIEPNESTEPFFSDYERARDFLHTQNWDQGIEELEELAHKGSVLSMLLIADAMRVGGWIYHQDLLGAEEWYRTAIEAGSARGLYGLALTQIKMNRYDEAIENLEAACSRHYPPAYAALADMHFQGTGVKSDRRTAEQLWRKAASMGHLGSKFNLVSRQVRGSYGVSGFLEGLTKLLPTAFEITMLRSRDPYSDHLR